MPRRKIRGALVLACLIFAFSVGLASAQSQPPAPSAGIPSSPKQQPSTSLQKESQPDQRRTEQLPLIIKIQNSPDPQAEAQQKADANERRTSEEHNFELGVASIVVGALQTVALVITFMVIACVGIGQLRAYIFPRVKNIKKFSLKEPVVIVMTFKNAGQTPAKYCECSGVVFVATLPLDPKTRLHEPTEQPGAPPHPKATIYPQADTQVDCELIDKLDAGTIALLKQKKAAIYVAGEARYRDIFRRKRRSEYCFYIDSDHAIALIQKEEGKAVALPPTINFVVSDVCNSFT